MSRRWALALVGVMALAPAAWGNGTNAGRILNMGLAARPLSLGSAFTGLADDLNAMQWNAAGIADTSRYTVDTHYSSLYDGLSYAGLAFGMPLMQDAALGISYAQLDSGSITRNSATNRGLFLSNDGSFSVKDSVITFSVASARYDPVRVGVNLKRVAQDLGGNSASAMTGDIGLLWDPLRRLRVGAAYRNLAGTLKFIEEDMPLPRTFAGGVSLRFLRDYNLAVAADVQKVREEKVETSLGAEYLILRARRVEADVDEGTEEPARLSGPAGDPLLAFRVGLRPTKASDLGGEALFTFGAGFYFSLAHLDYAFLNEGDLGMTHRISLGFSFGPKRLVVPGGGDEADPFKPGKSKKMAPPKRSKTGRIKLN